MPKQPLVTVTATLTEAQYNTFRAMFPDRPISDAIRHCIAVYADEHCPNVAWPEHQFLKGIGGNRGGGRPRKQPQELGE